MMAEASDLWVFGYGSLMWRPGFDFLERHTGRIHGFHRSLCVYSYHHRGTPNHPGLVLGLDRGGSCRGIAYRVAAGLRDGTVANLREREQVTSVYVERYADVTEAITREKQLKGWNRAWKINLIERSNPDWTELDPTACQPVAVPVSSPARRRRGTGIHSTPAVIPGERSEGRGSSPQRHATS